MKSLSFFLFVIFCLKSTASEQSYKDRFCVPPGKRLAENVSVEIDGCKPGETCRLPRGKNTAITVNFTPKSEIRKVDVYMAANIPGFAQSYVPLPEGDMRDACEGKGLKCPLKQGVPQKYIGSIPIKYDFPTVPITMRFRLLSGGEIIVCALVDKIQIVEP